MKPKLLALASAFAVPLTLAAVLRRPRAPAPVAEPVPSSEVAPVPVVSAVPPPTAAPAPPPADTAGPAPVAGMATRSGQPPGLRLPAPPPSRRERLGPCPRSGCNTPLVLSFDGAPVAYLADRTHAFDLDGAASRVTDWPMARTPWLALDRDGDGRISDGSELFGSMTVLSSGDRAPQGFAALRELDADGDGRLTATDPGFARLLVWSDGDGDRRSSPLELATASSRGIVSIELGFTSEPRCDARGNREVERAPFLYQDGAGVLRTGAVIDVHLAPQR